MAHNPELLVAEDEQGLVVWPHQAIACLTPELRRWRVVHHSGAVAHVPSAPQGLWRQLGDSWVRPQWLQRTDQGWLDPAGFTYPPVELEPLPQVPPLEPPGSLWLQADDAGACQWRMPEGWLSASGTMAEWLSGAALFAVSDSLALNLRALRRWTRQQHSYVLHLEGGTDFPLQLNRRRMHLLLQRLGLTGFDGLPFALPALQKHGLRDFPCELASASAQQLRGWFQHPRRLIANLAWQTVRLGQRGQRPEYGREHRGYWYVPVVPALYRAGFIKRPLRAYEDRDELVVLYRQVLADLVGDAGLFTYFELGFDDPGGRVLGDRRPEIVVLVEKVSLRPYAEKLQQQFGVSFLVMGGMSKLQEVEFLVRDLRDRGVGPIRIVAFVDFDPSGWQVASSFRGHLQRYGQQVVGGIDYLVVPQCFSAEEIELYALPCPAPNAAARTQRDRWLAESGGIGGRPLGIYANQLKPYERVAGRLAELL